MADNNKNKAFTSIIDAFLADREPDWKDLGLTDEKNSGDEQKDRTHQYVDTDFMDEIAESASKHTPVPPSKSATLQNRLNEKEKAVPQITAVQANWHKDAYPREGDFKNSEIGDNDSLFAEVTMSLEHAHSEGNLKENSADKKEVSDAAVQKYLRGLLNSGMAPSKVAQKLEKLAEIELLNHQSATDYLQRNAGMLGLAYLEPNTFMDKQSPDYGITGYGDRKHGSTKTAETSCIRDGCGMLFDPEAPETRPIETLRSFPMRYCPKHRVSPNPRPPIVERTASSNDCVRQHNDFKQAGITPRAKSVKQIKACEGCSFFKKDASGKRCNLYHLPVIANAEELSQIVNNLTPGVPLKQKRAALIQIADRTDEHVQPFDAGKTAQTNIVKTADAKVSNQALRKQARSATFRAEHVAKLHNKNVSLASIYEWADKKFGSVETSVAFRGFVQSFRKNDRGRIVVASGDLEFLNSIGIRNERFEGAKKCASCPNHFGHEARPVEDDRGVIRVQAKFAQRTPDAIRTAAESEAPIQITAAKVRALHQKGYSLEKIYKNAAARVGSVEAKKAVGAYVVSLKKLPGKIRVNASDHSFLIGKLGMKPETLRTLEAIRPEANRVVASSGETPLLAYPGMNDPTKKTASTLAVDGHAILNEYDLSGPVQQQDITLNTDSEDVETKGSFTLDVEDE